MSTVSDPSGCPAFDSHSRETRGGSGVGRFRAALAVAGDFQAEFVWLVVALIAAWRLANFWGLAHGNPDDMTIGYLSLKLGWETTAWDYATVQGRVYMLFLIPVLSIAMSLAGSIWYDILNLATFAAGGLLPILALRRYLNTEILQLFILIYFATLPMLFSYTPPYSYPIYMFLPLAFGGLSLVLLDEWYVRRRKSYLFGGCLALFGGICGYESATIVVVIFLLLWLWLSQNGRSVRDIWRRSEFGYCGGVVVIYGAIYFSFRLAFPTQYAGVHLAWDLGIKSICDVIGTLSFTSSIFGWYHFPQRLARLDVPTFYQMATLFRAPGIREMIDLATPQIIIGGIFVFCVSLRLAIRILFRATNWPTRFVLIAVIIFTAPVWIYAFVPKISRLVLAGRLFAYVPTAYSQTGFALLIVAILGSFRVVSNRRIRAGIAITISLIISWGWVAASEFNGVSAVFAREQEAKWIAIRNLGQCRNEIPSAVLKTVVAPRLWNFTTARLSWGAPEIEEHYWDLYARDRLGLPSHFVKSVDKLAAPVTVLDYRLGADGRLDGVIIVRSADRQNFQELFVIRQRRKTIPASVSEQSGWQAQTAARTSSCGGGLEIVHFTGAALDLPSAQIYGLPPWNPLRR